MSEKGLNPEKAQHEVDLAERIRRWLVPIIAGLIGALCVGALVIGFIVLELKSTQNDLSSKQRREAKTLRTTCERSKEFGPPLLDHLEEVERRLKLGALERMLEYPPHSGKKVRVLVYYRSTIPKSC